MSNFYIMYVNDEKELKDFCLKIDYLGGKSFSLIDPIDRLKAILDCDYILFNEPCVTESIHMELDLAKYAGKKVINTNIDYS